MLEFADRIETLFMENAMTKYNGTFIVTGTDAESFYLTPDRTYTVKTSKAYVDFRRPGTQIGTSCSLKMIDIFVKQGRLLLTPVL